MTQIQDHFIKIHHKLMNIWEFDKIIQEWNI
jgi:hypothetical protein